MELTVLSAEDLKPKSSPTLFPRRLRPFVTLTLPSPTNGDKPVQVYKTTVDDAGGLNPSWGDKFRIPLDNSTSSIYHQRQSSQYYYPLLYLQLCTKDLMGGQTQLGWCQIPAADVLDGLSPAGHVRRLSYRLRDRDGCRGHGVVNIAVKLDGSGPVMCPQSQRPSDSDRRRWLEMGLGQTVIGFPVRPLPAAETCQGKNF